MAKPTIECTRTIACRWKGTHDDLVKRRDEKFSKSTGVEVNEYVCPKCGCDTTYDLD